MEIVIAFFCLCVAVYIGVPLAALIDKITNWGS